MSHNGTTIPWDVFWQNFLQIGIVMGTIGIVIGIALIILWKVIP